MLSLLHRIIKRGSAEDETGKWETHLVPRPIKQPLRPTLHVVPSKRISR